MKNEITDFLELRNQFDVRLQGCDNDCTEYRRSTAQEVREIEGLGINCTEPSMEEIRAGMEAAEMLDITYCYRMLTGKKTYMW